MSSVSVRASEGTLQFKKAETNYNDKKEAEEAKRDDEVFIDYKNAQISVRVNRADHRYGYTLQDLYVGRVDYNHFPCPLKQEIGVDWKLRVRFDKPNGRVKEEGGWVTFEGYLPLEGPTEDCPVKTHVFSVRRLGPADYAVVATLEAIASANTQV